MLLYALYLVVGCNSTRRVLILVQTGNNDLSVLGMSSKRLLFFTEACTCARAALSIAFLPVRRWFSSNSSAPEAR